MTTPHDEFIMANDAAAADRNRLMEELAAAEQRIPEDPCESMNQLHMMAIGLEQRVKQLEGERAELQNAYDHLKQAYREREENHQRDFKLLSQKVRDVVNRAVAYKAKVEAWEQKRAKPAPPVAQPAPPK